MPEVYIPKLGMQRVSKSWLQLTTFPYLFVTVSIHILLLPNETHGKQPQSLSPCLCACCAPKALTIKKIRGSAQMKPPSWGSCWASSWSWSFHPLNTHRTVLAASDPLYSCYSQTRPWDPRTQVLGLACLYVSLGMDLDRHPADGWRTHEWAWREKDAEQSLCIIALTCFPISWSTSKTL